MNDSRLRELERRWRQSGLVDDEALYLNERVHAGDLDPCRLADAASLGHTGALRALGRAPGALGLRAFVTGLSPGSRETGARAVVAGARAMIAAGLQQGFEPELEAVERWLACPCDRHQRVVLMFGFAGDASDPEDACVEPEGPLRAWFAVTYLSSAVLRVDGRAALHDLAVAARALEEHGDPASLADRVRAELIPWLLDGRDPIRERLAPE